MSACVSCLDLASKKEVDTYYFISFFGEMLPMNLLESWCSGAIFQAWMCQVNTIMVHWIGRLL